MEENKNCTGGARSSNLLGAGLPFLIGLIIALIFGWAVFPDLIFSEKKQPLFFSHEAHVENAGMGCFDCHSFRADGSFTGVPDIETCASCHQDYLTPEPDDDATAEEKAYYAKAHAAEKILLEEYIEGGKELPWKIHQWQPDNVFFSHATHYKACYTCHLTMKGDKNLGTPENPERLCMTCHPSMDELNADKPVEENVLTGYSRTTMKMWECESCHAHPGHFYDDGRGRTTANNACYTCHK